MTPLTTAAAATRVIRSPPGSQLERNRAFWRMISASFMQVSDAHLHRRNRRRSASVTRSSATPPRRASSSSSSDTADAGAAADGDYELEERSAGNTPRRRSATGSRAISPAAPRKHTPRKSKSPASPSSSRASKQGDSDDSSGELSSGLCLSDSNREQLATPAGKQAGSKRKRASSTRYTSNKELPSWTSDQPTGVLRAPAKPMDQPQLAAPSAEPALKLIHGDNDWMQGRSPQGLVTLGWIMPVKGKPKPSGHWSEKVLRITPRCPLAVLKPDTIVNQGSVRQKAVLGKGVVHVCFHPKDPNDAAKGVCGWTWSTTVKPTKMQRQKLGINANLVYAEDVRGLPSLS